MSHTSHLRPSSSPHITVLLFPSTQLLDLSPIDLFGMLHPSYLSTCALPSPLVASGTPFTISYAADAPADSVAELTAAAALRVSHNLSDKALAPGNVDVLLIPGPEPNYEPSKAEIAFMQAHAAAGAYILTVCTGVFAAGRAGLLAGKRVTGPRALLGTLRAIVPDAEVTEKRWEVDCGGRVWSAGGITNGLEMGAAFLREVYGGPVADVVCRIADVGERGQEYQTGMAGEGVFFLWAVVRSWAMGLVGGRKEKGKRV